MTLEGESAGYNNMASLGSAYLRTLSNNTSHDRNTVIAPISHTILGQGSPGTSQDRRMKPNGSTKTRDNT